MPDQLYDSHDGTASNSYHGWLSFIRMISYMVHGNQEHSLLQRLSILVDGNVTAKNLAPQKLFSHEN